MTAPAISHATFISPSISCGHCVGKVRNALSSIEGVTDVQASVETRFVDVDFDPDLTTEEQIKAAMADAGYPAQG